MRGSDDPEGSCHDSCWVDTAGNVYHTNEEFDRTVANGGTVVVDTRCHDGGPNSGLQPVRLRHHVDALRPGRTVAYYAPTKYGVSRRLSASSDQLPKTAATAVRHDDDPFPPPIPPSPPPSPSPSPLATAPSAAAAATPAPRV